MTRDEAIRRLFNIERCTPIHTREDVRDFEALEMAIKALEQEPCEDAISRKWLKTAIHNFYYGLKHTPTEDDIQAYINAAPPVNPQEPCDTCRHYENGCHWLPSVTPQKPKTGHWIRWYEQIENDVYTENIPHCKCSECGKEYDPYSSQFIKYCNECGVKMESEEEE